MSGLILPPGSQEPDPAVAVALEELAAAREERREASRVIALLVVGQQDAGDGILFARRREIELQVAELRLQLWSDELRRLEARVRSLGIRP